jgi:Cof subfamily protein (haloacid dehalogenase superfamily)
VTATEPKLAAFDLDGTLLTSAGKVSDGNAVALRGLAARGVVLAPATARMYQAAVRPFADLGLEVAAIASGGADVRLAGGGVVAQPAIDLDAASWLARRCEELGWQANFTTTERTFRLAAELPPWAENAPAWMKPVTTLEGCDLSALVSVLITLHSESDYHAELEPLAGRISAHRAISYNGDLLLTVTAAGVDKGTGLAALCDALGIELREAAAFGDSEVDLPMFGVAGTAVAMGDAAPEIRAAATIVCVACNDDGVADGIARVWG